ncbi:S8 family serine peptidase [Pelagibaculum spongiae]|uniref:S8 family serine peptidase n=1 Tax=Pelagibaculum spongiae TaxID=2080658 RepID=UPI001314237A|nr:S8 family serine peptidase [Pelagibaculum spongiae]
MQRLNNIYYQIKKNTKLSIVLVITFLINACGGSSGSSSTPADDFSVSIGQTFHSTLPGAIAGNQPYIFSVINAPAEFTLLDASNGRFSYFSTENSGEQVINYRYSDSQTQLVDKTITLKMKDDPLFSQQWHLQNTGQKAFAFYAGTAGEDINLTQTIKEGIDGSGITVAVVDGGLEIAHEDLQPNIVSGSRDFVGGDSDPTPASISDFHGTAVAGIIASKGWNDLGGRGVAPNANLIGFNYLSAQSLANFTASHGGGENTARIYNMSYGVNYIEPQGGGHNDSELAHIEDQVINSNLFDGLGRFYIKASGNGFDRIYFNETNYQRSASSELPFQNSNQSPFNAYGYTTVVSAINAAGDIASYSTWGSNVFISAPGGEYGSATSNTLLVNNNEAEGSEPAIITTDRSGCNSGISRSSSFSSVTRYPFLSGIHALNPQCNYSNVMNGTSAATPIISGAIALILDANPALDWREVRHILLTTAEKVQDGQGGDADDELTVGSSSFVVHDGWVPNDASYSYNNKFGFGRVNVDAAVAAAKAWNTDLGTFNNIGWIDSGALTQSIPNNSTTGAFDETTITSSLTVEMVQVRLTATHERIQDLAIVLISPAGTESIIMTPNNSFLGNQIPNVQDVTGYNDTLMLSHAFYGESANGIWKIKLVDTSGATISYLRGSSTLNVSDNSTPGILTNWKIRVLGH